MLLTHGTFGEPEVIKQEALVCPLDESGSQHLESWPVVRRRPEATIYGRAMTLLIGTGPCHLANVDVYRGGLVGALGLASRSGFKRELDIGSVASGMAVGAPLAIFGLGGSGLVNGVWTRISDDIRMEIDAVVTLLGPHERGHTAAPKFYADAGANWRPVPFAVREEKPYRVDAATGGEVLGHSITVLRRTERGFAPIQLFIFADDRLRIGAHGPLFGLWELPSRFASGEITNEAPAGSLVELPGFGEFRPDEVFGGVAVDDLIGEVHDILGELNGRPSIAEACIRVLHSYLAERSDHAEEALRIVYESVPRHLRTFCAGDIRSRDRVIREVLYGEEAKPSPEGACLAARRFGLLRAHRMVDGFGRQEVERTVRCAAEQISHGEGALRRIADGQPVLGGDAAYFRTAVAGLRDLHDYCRTLLEWWAEADAAAEGQAPAQPR